MREASRAWRNTQELRGWVAGDELRRMGQELDEAKTRKEVSVHVVGVARVITLTCVGARPIWKKLPGTQTEVMVLGSVERTSSPVSVTRKLSIQATPEPPGQSSQTSNWFSRLNTCPG